MYATKVLITVLLFVALLSVGLEAKPKPEKAHEPKAPRSKSASHSHSHSHGHSHETTEKPRTTASHSHSHETTEDTTEEPPTTTTTSTTTTEPTTSTSTSTSTLTSTSTSTTPPMTTTVAVTTRADAATTTTSGIAVCIPEEVPLVRGWLTTCGCIDGYNTGVLESDNLEACTTLCMRNLGVLCRSVEFSERLGRGRCVYSTEDRHSRPQSYTSPCYLDPIIHTATIYAEPRFARTMPLINKGQLGAIAHEPTGHPISTRVKPQSTSASTTESPVYCNSRDVPAVIGWITECGCLKDYNTGVLEADTLQACTVLCMRNLGVLCRSVEFSLRKGRGRCVYSTEDQHTRPQSFSSPCYLDAVIEIPTIYAEPHFARDFPLA